MIRHGKGINHEGHEVSRRLCFPGFPSCTFVPLVVHGLPTDPLPTTTPARSQLVKMLVAKSTTATLPLHGIRLDQTKGAQVKGRGD